MPYLKGARGRGEKGKGRERRKSHAVVAGESLLRVSRVIRRGSILAEMLIVGEGLRWKTRGLKGRGYGSGGGAKRGGGKAHEEDRTGGRTLLLGWLGFRGEGSTGSRRGAARVRKTGGTYRFLSFITRAAS